MAIQLPQLIETRCIGCGECAPICPTDCLMMAGPLPLLAKPLDCISCCLCVIVCPVDALRIEGYEKTPRAADARGAEWESE